MNKAAQALGRWAKGVKKTLTDEQRDASRKRLAKVRGRRWESAEVERLRIERDDLRAACEGLLSVAVSGADEIAAAKAALARARR